MKPCNIFFLSVALFVSINLSAQTNDIGTIRGTVVNESTNQPLEFVSVLLYRDSDSTIVTGTSTENNGKLELINIPTGEYYIRFSLIGYKERVTPVFVIDARHKRLNLGTISLVETTVNMNEVEVTAEKPLFNYSIGKKVYNVDQDIMSQSFSASEVL